MRRSDHHVSSGSGSHDQSWVTLVERGILRKIRQHLPCSCEAGRTKRRSRWDNGHRTMGRMKLHPNARNRTRNKARRLHSNPKVHERVRRHGMSQESRTSRADRPTEQSGRVIRKVQTDGKTEGTVQGDEREGLSGRTSRRGPRVNQEGPERARRRT